MRRLHKQWSDKKPFQRRARWFASVDDWQSNIRINFCDSLGVANIFYGGLEAAKFDWEQFKSNRIDTPTLRQGR